MEASCLPRSPFNASPAAGIVISHSASEKKQQPLRKCQRGDLFLTLRWHPALVCVCVYVRASVLLLNTPAASCDHFLSSFPVRSSPAVWIYKVAPPVEGLYRLSTSLLISPRFVRDAVAKNPVMIKCFRKGNGKRLTAAGRLKTINN